MSTDRKVGPNRGNAGKGRPKGSKNKTTAALKEAILLAAEGAHEGGSVGYLTWLANNNSSAFASLLGRVLPTTLTGDKDNPIKAEVLITGVRRGGE
ncbi:MAG TPA: hypothetical protein VGU45_01595 [Microvirga sp.]|jgi:hypothetical protein|nr:hypothetical protein [Microvirga sp.]